MTGITRLLGSAVDCIQLYRQWQDFQTRLTNSVPGSPDSEDKSLQYVRLLQVDPKFANAHDIFVCTQEVEKNLKHLGITLSDRRLGHAIIKCSEQIDPLDQDDDVHWIEQLEYLQGLARLIAEEIADDMTANTRALTPKRPDSKKRK